MMQPRKTLSLLLLLALLHIFVAREGRAAEEALSPDFLEYLGTVEASGVKGMEDMTLEEMYQMLKKVFGGSSKQSKQKEGSVPKESEHGNVTQK